MDGPERPPRVPIGNIVLRGETTFAEILAFVTRIPALVREVAESLAEAVGETNLSPESLGVTIPAATVSDSDHFDENVAWSAPCDERCARAIPAFFGSPCAILFICRTCGERTCWRHARTNTTGGWCAKHDE